MFLAITHSRCDSLQASCSPCTFMSGAVIQSRARAHTHRPFMLCSSWSTAWPAFSPKKCLLIFLHHIALITSISAFFSAHSPQPNGRDGAHKAQYSFTCYASWANTSYATLNSGGKTNLRKRTIGERQQNAPDKQTNSPELTNHSHNT